jgi:hypothetical protein
MATTKNQLARRLVSNEIEYRDQFAPWQVALKDYVSITEAIEVGTHRPGKKNCELMSWGCKRRIRMRGNVSRGRNYMNPVVTTRLCMKKKYRLKDPSKPYQASNFMLEG